MITLTIDGKTVNTNENTTILDAARSIGIDIPTMCHCEKAEPSASCFVCVVKVDGNDNFIPSCAAIAQDGMVINTCSDDVKECRKRAIELLFSEHTGNCCGKKNSCPLKNYAIEYGAHRSRYAVGQRKQYAQKLYDSGLVHEPGKCIVCGKCVAITKQKGINPGLTFHGRGSNVYVSAPFETPLDKAMGEALVDCVEACPTGAFWMRGEQ